MKTGPKKVSFSFEGKQFSLRAPDPSDAGVLALAVRESLASLERFMPWANEANSQRDSQFARLVAVQADYLQGKDYNFTLFTGETECVGGFGLHRRTLNDLGLEIGYWVHPKMQGKGLCTYVTKVLICVGFEFFGCERVQVLCDEGNPGSRRVIEKCSFVKEGMLRKFGGMTPKMIEAGGTGNCEIYSLIPSDVRGLEWYGSVKNGLTITTWD